GEAVRKAGDIHGAAGTEAVDGHLHFLLVLDEYLRALKGVHVLLTLAEVGLAVAVGQDEVAGVLVPVVLVVAEGEAGLLLHAKHLGELDIASLVLVSGGLAHADEAAAVIYEAFHGAGDIRVLPPDAAGVGGVAAADVYQHVYAVEH